MSKATGRLQDKVSIVTGGASGIGKAVVKTFAREGSKVVIADIDPKGGEALAATLRSEGKDVTFIKVDLRSAQDTEKLAEETMKKYGSVDILCQNAGIYPVVAFEKMTEADWDKVIGLNLKGTFLVIRACIPYMLKQSYGRIVITSSVTGPRVVIPGMVHYAASKAGVNGMIRTLAVEFAKNNIRVNGIEPGTVDTEGNQAAPGNTAEGFKIFAKKYIPIGRVGLPQDMADAYLFLASDESSFITGQTIIVDGGQILPELRDSS